tara:strand:- start:6 stop:953 length:948 start_codon:yes stop_codon:yes gene_type:complete
MSRIEDEVCKKIAQRAEVGKSKYGVTMETSPISRLEWLIHAQEEAMDLAVYLQKLIEMETPIEEEESFPIKEAYEQLTDTNSPVPVHKVLSQVIESRKLSMGEANKLLENEKSGYNFTFQEGVSMMQIWIHPNKEVKYSPMPSPQATHPKRCEAITTHGTRCTNPVHHDRPQYNNPHKPCKKEKLLCWQHCDCGAIHKAGNEADLETSPTTEILQGSRAIESSTHLTPGQCYKYWFKAYDKCVFYALEGYGDGWCRQEELWLRYMDNGVSKSTTQRHFDNYGRRLFNARKIGKRVYLQENFAGHMTPAAIQEMKE